jgi:hypothetical protein
LRRERVVHLISRFAQWCLPRHGAELYHRALRYHPERREALRLGPRGACPERSRRARHSPPAPSSGGLARSSNRRNTPCSRGSTSETSSGAQRGAFLPPRTSSLSGARPRSAAQGAARSPSLPSGWHRRAGALRGGGSRRRNSFASGR